MADKLQNPSKYMNADYPYEKFILLHAWENWLPE